jgi:protein-arginine kinase activator protein McsA
MDINRHQVVFHSSSSNIVATADEKMKKFACEFCSQNFAKASILKSHHKISHPLLAKKEVTANNSTKKGEKMIVCDTCGATFKSRGAFGNHCHKESHGQVS